MKLTFRQGLVKTQKNFLQVTLSGVNLLASTSEFIASASHSESEYLIKEFNSVNSAWGTFSSDVWLFIDIDVLTGQKSFGSTLLEPVFSNTQPVSPANDQHWYDKNTLCVKVYSSSTQSWIKKVRVFLAKLDAGKVPNYIYAVGQSQAGISIASQSLVNNFPSGTIIFDRSYNPIYKSNGEFFTTEDDLLVDGFAQYIRLESNTLIVKANENIPAYHAITMTSSGVIELAEYEDTEEKIIGIVSDNVLIGNMTSVLVQGIISNPDWANNNWITNDKIWVSENGELVNVDPYETSPLTHPNKKVPVGRVISKNTILFEQGLGGVGPAGTGGGSVSPATSTTYGTVKLTSPSASTIVVSDNDSRMIPGNTFASVSHVHTATNISSIPTGFITASNVQSALSQISTDVVLKTGSTMLADLDMGGNKIINLDSPTNSLDAVNKDYVDGLVSGLTWKEPIHVVNLISDSELMPPISPNVSDVYIVPSAGALNWGFPANSVVYWDGSVWVSDVHGLLSAHSANTRFGISMESVTVASGTFTGKDNQIAILTNPAIPSWSFYTPISNDAVYVNNAESLHAFHQYVFDGTKWIEFGGTDNDTLGELTPTKGNLVSADGTSWSTLGVGTNDYVLTADSTQPLGVKWASAAQPITLTGDVTGSGTGSITTALATVPISKGGTGQITSTAAFDALSPITSIGDLIIGDGLNSSNRLAIGTNGQVLTSNGTTATWTTIGSGTPSIVDNGNAVAMTIDSTENIGIGTSSPTTELGTIGRGLAIYGSESQVGIRIHSTDGGGGQLSMYSKSGVSHLDGEGTQIVFSQNGVVGLRYSNNHRLGIQCDSTRPLQVHQSTAGASGIKITNNFVGANDTYAGLDILLLDGEGTARIYNWGAHALSFGNSNIDRITIATDGGIYTQGATGSSMGVGKINTTGLYVNGVAVLTSQSYDILTYIEGKPASGSTSLFMIAPRSFQISTTVGSAFSRSEIASTGAASFDVRKNGISFGTISFAAAATTAVVSLTTTSFVAGDNLTIIAPSPQDSTLANISISLPGVTI